MKNRERVINAFNHKDSDYIPWHIGCTIEEDENLREYLNDDNYMDKHIKHFGSSDAQAFSPNYMINLDISGMNMALSGIVQTLIRISESSTSC